MELDQKQYSNDDDHNTNYEEDEPLLLPGFRFSPTDEELVGFYLRRKVEKKCTNIELIIKHVDIYNYNPWDLPTKVGAVGEKEIYVFCRRGRKYKNSFRPNRVAGSGFWKATGIDKLIYDHRRSNVVIGLKKTLVFYCGSAGKGTKTNWMMHEFRLPPAPNDASKTSLEEAEVWTVCRILKREVCRKKNMSSSKQNQVLDWNSYETVMRSCSSTESDNIVDDQVNEHEVMYGMRSKTTSTTTDIDDHQLLVAAASNYVSPVGDDYGVSSWDELRPMIHFIL